MSEIERVISEVLQIKSQYQKEVAGSRKQWPRAIKDRVRELATGHELSLREISEGTGISYYTIDRSMAQSMPQRESFALPPGINEPLVHAHG